MLPRQVRKIDGLLLEMSFIRATQLVFAYCDDGTIQANIAFKIFPGGCFAQNQVKRIIPSSMAYGQNPVLAT